MLVLLREVHHLRDLGFGHFISENAANADALLMNMNHNPRSLIRIHLKKRLEHVYDKFHRRVIVVQQQHFIQAWLFGFRARARGKADPRSAAIFIVIILRHQNQHPCEIEQRRGSLQAPFAIYSLTPKRNRPFLNGKDGCFVELHRLISTSCHQKEERGWQVDDPPAQYLARAYAAFLKSSVVAAMRFEIGWNISLTNLTIASVFFEPCATAVSKPLRANSP